MSERYIVRDDGDRAALVDWQAPHATHGTAPRVLSMAWSDDEPGVAALFAERDRLRAEVTE